ncbi:MAG: hypothetical protein ABFD83_01115 [Armatimonadota bacterium]
MLLRLSCCLLMTVLSVSVNAQSPEDTLKYGNGADSSLMDTALEETLPPWADAVAAVDTTNTGAAGPSASFTVYLGTGVYQNNPMSDFGVNNPTGPSVDFSRLYRTCMAAKGLCSQGFSAGWTHSYDDTIIALPNDAQGKLILVWYNGAKEELIPQVKDGKLTGELANAKKPPYFVMGKFGSAAGQWQSLTMTFADDEKWVFTPDSHNAGLYRLRQISDIVGKPISLCYDSYGRLEKITQSDGKPLLSIAYSSSGYVSDIFSYDNLGKISGQRKYVFGQVEGQTCLTAVSQENNTKALHWSYGYTLCNGKPFLISVSVPNPKGTGLSTAKVVYDPLGRTQAIIDANTNKHSYTYGSGETKVTVTGPGSGG